MKTSIYIDGFNFYYGCFDHGRNASAKWVDFRSLFAAIFPNDTIHRIHYCTARVSGTTSDPDKPVRQQTHLDALGTTPRFTVHLGSFNMRTKRGDLVSPLRCLVNPPCLTGRVTVRVPEEKGSDVNLATALLRDAFTGDFEQAIVVSNDSDLASAVHAVRVHARLPIVVVSPHPNPRVTNKLKSAATSSIVLDQTLLTQHQLPSQVKLKDGRTVLKPTGW